MKEKLVNVTCSNEACSKPLFAFHMGKRVMNMESYGASIRPAPRRLGVDPSATALCESCGTETPIPLEVVQRIPGMQ